MRTATNDLATSLRHNPVTNVKVSINTTANWAKRRATHLWIAANRGSGWEIYDQSLASIVTRTQELGTQYTNTITSSIKTPRDYTRFPGNIPNVLYMVETDQQTPQFVYEGIQYVTTHSTSRILNIQWTTTLRLS